jgi:NAD kinase
VNLGQLGYLTEVEPIDLRRAIADVLAGRHQIEQRMLVEVVLPGGSAIWR